MKASMLRVEFDYPVFKKFGFIEQVELDKVRKALSKIDKSMAEEIVKEREEEWK
ncbi:MAG: hypothetical protein QW532_07100 [Archaeoglobaceae archaeon]